MIKMDSFSLELKLVLLCSQIKIKEIDRQVLNQLLVGPIDWELFLDLTEHHQVYPLVFQCLSSLEASAVPDQVMTVLRQKGWKNTSRTLQMTGELVNVLRALERKELRAVVLKGFPLGYRLYGNLALRPSRDLDVLVWPEDVDKAIKAIEKQGYERMHLSAAEIPRRRRNRMKTSHHIVYRHRDREIRLELHWKLGHCGLEIPLKEIEQSLTQVKIAGQAMTIPGAEELLLFLVLHGVSHAWFRLKWLCDIGVMLRQGEFCWDRLYGLAERLGFQVLLNQAVILAHTLLQAPVPDNILKRIRQDRKALNLVSMALPFMITVNYEPANFSKLMYYRRQKYEFSIQLGWRKKAASLYRKLSPQDRDLELIPLPEYLYFLYYLIRPFTWFRCKAMELAGSSPRRG